MSQRPFAKAREVTRYTAQLVRAPRRVLPSQAAAQSMKSEKGPWDPALAPVMIEPLDLLGSREYNGIVFVGPARTGKTMSLILGGITYIVTCAPGDMLVTLMSQDTARDFSRMDLDRVLRHSPDLLDALSPRAKDDNTYDKFFRSGIALKIGWPAISQLSQKTLRYVFLTDYDRPENRDDVDGEGPMWDLAYKRIETFMSRGKCLAESSPKAEYLDAAWRASTPHEAPPCRGILDLYNRGTRARLYWPCLDCGSFFEASPGLKNFTRLPAMRELEDLVQHQDLMMLAEKFALVGCTSCGALHQQQQRPEMSKRARWVHEGQIVTPEGEVIGPRRGTKIASYWLGGVAASFQRWDSLLLKYLQALAGFMRTGEEQALKFTVNTDQGAAYLPRVATQRRATDELRKRLEDWPRGKIPQGVRFLTAAVDVQSSRYVVHVMGWGPGLESWLIDRFVISSSKRPEGERFAALEPSAYLEDWELITEQVMDRGYQPIGHEFEVRPRLVACDSGGKTGVTARAYSYFRWLRKRRKHRSLRLVKGTGRMDAATVTLTWPDATDRKDRKQGGRGDVPVWLINTNVLKDAIVGDLARVEHGAGFVHLPKWLEEDNDFFAELAAETRTDKGWKNLNRARNEAFDLHVYNRAAVKILKADKLNWTKPPAWAQPLEEQKSLWQAPADPATSSGQNTAPPPAPRPPTAPRRPPRRGWIKGWRR
jgi:phage terminase large subunit GpA-like protein